MNSREFFDRMANEWDNIVNHDTKKIRSILAQICLRNGDSVLDAGTGTGVMIPYLYELVGEAGNITAVDISERMIEVAKGKFSFKNVHFVAGDVLEADLPEEFFNCVMCYSMFPHFQDKKAAVLRLAQYLKSEGMLVIAHSQSRDAINSLHREVSDEVREDELPTADVIRKYFGDAGLVTAVVIDNEDMFVLAGRKL